PDLVLDDDKLERYDRIKADDNLIHGLADGTTEVVSQVSSIEDMAEGDARLRDYTVDSIQRLSQQDAPFFITHAFMKVHAD
ncbi:hypothetical protein R0K18_34585, partial [Pantoea sp. SIMBA_133]